MVRPLKKTLFYVCLPLVFKKKTLREASNAFLYKFLISSFFQPVVQGTESISVKYLQFLYSLQQSSLSRTGIKLTSVSQSFSQSVSLFPKVLAVFALVSVFSSFSCLCSSESVFSSFSCLCSSESVFSSFSCLCSTKSTNIYFP